MEQATSGRKRVLLRLQQLLLPHQLPDRELFEAAVVGHPRPDKGLLHGWDGPKHRRPLLRHRGLRIEANVGPGLAEHSLMQHNQDLRLGYSARFYYPGSTVAARV